LFRFFTDERLCCGFRLGLLSNEMLPEAHKETAASMIHKVRLSGDSAVFGEAKPHISGLTMIKGCCFCWH
jgi:hypothetical protein